jgi:hypothetical protein
VSEVALAGLTVAEALLAAALLDALAEVTELPDDNDNGVDVVELLPHAAAARLRTVMLAVRPAVRKFIGIPFM